MTNAVRIALEPEAAPPPIDRSVKVATAAAILDCDESYVRRLFREGKLNGHRLGIRGVRISLASIEAYRESGAIDHSKPATPAPAAGRRKRQSAEHQESIAFLKALGAL